MFATELVKPIETFLENAPQVWAIDRHTYRLVDADLDSAFRPQYRVLPYGANSLEAQPQTASAISVQYVGTASKQQLGEAEAYSHQFRLVSVSANSDVSQNNRDYGLLALTQGTIEKSLWWANHDYLGQFAIVARVPPTRDTRSNYLCSASFVISLGKKDDGCMC